MMFKQQDEMHTDEPFEMTAMVDVVFILLTFFIISAQMFGAEHDVAMHYRTSTQTQGLAQGDLPPSIVITLHNLDEKTVGLTLGQRELLPNDYAAITQMLQTINLPDLPVVVQSQGDVLIDNVTRAVDSVLASPMKKVSLAKSPLAVEGIARE
jgi:biopolymer transport protein ExbD